MSLEQRLPSGIQLTMAGEGRRLRAERIQNTRLSVRRKAQVDKLEQVGWGVDAVVSRGTARHESTAGSPVS